MAFLLQGLCSGWTGLDLFERLASNYKTAAKDTLERSLDNTSTQSLWQLQDDGSDWDRLSFHPHHTGSAPAARAWMIGLRHPAEESFEAQPQPQPRPGM